MPVNALDPETRTKTSALPYTAPFIAFIALMVIERTVALPLDWLYPIRFLASIAILLAVSRPVISLRASAPLASAVVGALVFLIWIAPDLLFGPHYRAHWIFSNPVTGSPATSLPGRLRTNPAFLLIRVVSCAAVVPILEELFWRGWLMRWLIDRDFWRVPLGTYAKFAFWTVAALFASEHGPYWEVGLAAGIVYNWWCIRTKCLADCILAHAVTNGILSIYVLFTGQWQYWL